MAAVIYSLLESAKLFGLEPKAYLRAAVQAALKGEQVPLPHELAAARPSSPRPGALAGGGTGLGEDLRNGDVMEAAVAVCFASAHDQGL